MAENDIAKENTAPKSEKQQDMTKFLMLTISSIIIMFVVFAGVNYVIMENLISQKISTIQPAGEEISEEEGEDEIQKGIIVDLGDFILNLCDENQKEYLKVNVAIEVSQKDEDFAAPAEQPKKGGHGEEAAPAVEEVVVEEVAAPADSVVVEEVAAEAAAEVVAE